MIQLRMKVLIFEINISLGNDLFLYYWLRRSVIIVILLDDKSTKVKDNLSKSHENANEANDGTEYVDETSNHNLKSTDKPQSNSEEDIEEEEDTKSSKNNTETRTNIENENDDAYDYDKESHVKTENGEENNDNDNEVKFTEKPKSTTIPAGDKEVYREEPESSRDHENVKNEEDGNNDIGEKETPNEYQDNLSSSSGVGSEENDIRSVEGFKDGKFRSMIQDEKEDDSVLHDDDNEQEEENTGVSVDTEDTEKPKNFTVKSSNEESGKLFKHYVLSFIFIFYKNIQPTKTQCKVISIFYRRNINLDDRRDSEKCNKKANRNCK